jgi:hypothetical protein
MFFYELECSFDLDYFIYFKDILRFYIIEAGDFYAALKAVSDLPGIVFEMFERFNLAVVPDDDVIANKPDSLRWFRLRKF